MSVSTSSSLKSHVETSKLPSTKGSKDAKDGRFKTSNPQIFPSLHPLANFYREKTKVVPKSAFPAPKTVSICDPVKKVKTNDNTEKVIMDSIIQINEEKIQDQPLKCDDDGFRIPRLPSRFNKNDKKTVVEEPKQPEAVKVQLETNAAPEDLIIPECVIQDLKSKQTVGFVPRKPVTILQQAPIRVPQPVKQETIMISQQELLMMLLMRSLEQESIYDQVDVISSQLRQSVPHLFQICQQNQAKLIQKV